MEERARACRILLVDDDRAITAHLAPFLERAGFVVAVAADGEAALRQVAGYRPDLVVLDVLMPRLNGRETLRRLRQAGDWTPVILLGDTIEIRAFEDGASVAVEVADTGPGIRADELPHLGEELYRGSAPRSVEGSGLGLALVQAIAARHRGTLTIRSRHGQGTVVTIRLPASR